MSEARSARSRQTLWIVWVVAGAAALICAYLAGRLVTSPWAQAQENSEHSVLASVAVEQRGLDVPQVTIAGVIKLGTSLEVRPVSAATGATQVVTSTRHIPGEVIASGDALVDISDRPIIGLRLPFTMYRDLHFGDSGADVRAVQEALLAAGFYSGEPDGIFGDKTATAVRALYSKVGMPVPAPTAEVAEEVEDLASQVAERDAGRIATTGPNGETITPPPLTLTEKALDLRLAEAKRAAGPWLPMGEVVALSSATMTVVGLAPVGTVITDSSAPAVTLRGEGASAVVRVGLANATLFPVGGSVVISALDGTAVTTVGTVSAVSDFVAATDAESLPGYDVTVQIPEPAGLTDQARVSASPDVIATTQFGMVVPLVAVREDNAGKYVLVLVNDAPDAAPVLRRVDVRPGLQQDGYVIVDAIDLAPDDRVVVGSTG